MLLPGRFVMSLDILSPINQQRDMGNTWSKRKNQKGDLEQGVQDTHEARGVARNDANKIHTTYAPLISARCDGRKSFHCDRTLSPSMNTCRFSARGPGGDFGSSADEHSLYI